MLRVLFLVFGLQLIGIHSAFTQDFSAVDQHAQSVKAGDDLSVLVQELVAPFTSELDQVRAIFTYVTTTVRYDCKEFHRDRDDRKATSREAILTRAFEKQLGVCSGYAILFDEMCSLAGINAEVISGYARISPRPPSVDRLRSNHAWNAVEIDGEWHLLDPTWAAGYTDSEVKKFTFQFDESYFLTEPERFFQRHWPMETQWQLLEPERSAEEFASLPHFYRLPSGLRLSAFSPEVGILSTEEESFQFRFELEGADGVFLTMGSRRLELEESEEGVYTFTMEGDRVRGRRFAFVALKEDRLIRLIEYRIQ